MAKHSCPTPGLASRYPFLLVGWDEHTAVRKGRVARQSGLVLSRWMLNIISQSTNGKTI